MRLLLALGTGKLKGHVKQTFVEELLSIMKNVKALVDCPSPLWNSYVDYNVDYSKDI
jgi:hypothetical protein